jgi:hypothetical protein
MKTAVSFLLLLFLGVGAGAQSAFPKIEEKPVAIGVSSKLPGAVKLSYFPGENQNQYLFTYHNLDSPQYYEPETISLYGDEQDLEEFYKFLKKGFASRESRIKNIGNGERIMVDYAYSSIRIAVLRKNGLNSLFFLSQKQLDRLFGKN